MRNSDNGGGKNHTETAQIDLGIQTNSETFDLAAHDCDFYNTLIFSILAGIVVFFARSDFETAQEASEVAVRLPQQKWLEILQK